MADRFYTPDSIPVGEYTLAGSDAHHMISVRRFAVGDRVTLFNGDGLDYPATVAVVGSKRVLLTIEPGIETHRERPDSLWMASAIPKGDRADYLIEKLTELGVTRFTPLICERSVVISKASTEAKFRKQVIEASKQCGRNRLMRVDAAMPFTRLLIDSELPAERWLMHTAEGLRLPAQPSGVARLMAIGPEGGFAPEEVDAARTALWQAATLGPRVLRVETAAVVACA